MNQQPFDLTASQLDGEGAGPCAVAGPRASNEFDIDGSKGSYARYPCRLTGIPASPPEYQQSSTGFQPVCHSSLGIDPQGAARWQPKARKATPYLNERGSWLIFCDRHGLGEALVSQLREQGENCLQISPGRSFQALRGEGWYWLNPAHSHDFRRLFQELQAGAHPPCRGIVYLWSQDDLLLAEMCTRNTECAQTLGLTAFMHVIQGVARSSWCEIPKLWVVTRGTQRIDSAPLSIPAQDSCATLWEMALALGDPPRSTLWGGLIDLDPAHPCDEAALLFDELWHSDGEDDQIALRHGERYVPQVTV